MSSNAADDEVFIYTGPRGEIVPKDVVRVRVNQSIVSLPVDAFCGHTNLTEVELSEGLVEIGDGSFRMCNNSITKINIPTSLRRICNDAFCNSLQNPIHLHDGIESIGERSFGCCIFTNFRVPLLIKVIPDSMLFNCKSTFSVEIPNNATEIDDFAFSDCFCLRNVAFPPDAVIGYKIFLERDNYSDLQELFGSQERIIIELQHRFDGLPIHKLVYYQSYHQGVLQNLITAIYMRSSHGRALRSELNLTGDQQDCLGMTPLHILACSSVHDIEVYRVIIDNYPTNLITEDRWGAVPLLYAFWGAAPTDIIQFMMERYQSIYPHHQFNWTMMVDTMGRCDTPKENIEKLLHVKQMYFPEQSIDWEYLLDKFANDYSHLAFYNTFRERLQFLVMCGMSLHVEALAFKVWRDNITHMIQTAAFGVRGDNSVVLREIRAKFAYFEDEFPKLKESTTIIELALWKMSMNENIPQEEATHCQKKTKVDKSSIQRRITCGADVVIRHVLPYLITFADDES